MFSRPLRFLSSKTAQNVIFTRGIQQNLKTASVSQVVPVQIDVPWGKIDGEITSFIF